MARVLLENLSKCFGSNKVVDDVNLEIFDKEFIVFVGPSGCGKTTTLRMIAGLENITEGNIYIGDRLVNKLPPKDRDIAMVFQNYALYPHMNVYSNMTFALRLQKMPKDEIKIKVEETARLLGIQDLLHRKPSELSGGQRQRVALGRAIVREPQVFLMDEPLSNLDAKLRVQMRLELEKLHRRIKTTIIYVTHDQIEAMTLGERIIVMNNGVIQQVGTPHEVYNNPANVFVAGFIGSPPINFLEGLLTKKDDQILFQCSSFHIPLSQQRCLDDFIGKEVVFGIRPEDVSLTDADGSDVISSQVEFVESVGSDIYAYLLRDSCKVTARASSKVLLKPGQNIKFSFNLDAVHLFAKESGMNLLRSRAINLDEARGCEQ